MSTFSLWAAIRTVKSRIGTWVGFREMREVDPTVTEAEWARAVGQARAALANKSVEMTRPLNRRPLATEITSYTSKRQTGYLQTVDVWVKDRDTGLLEVRPYAIRTQTLRSRGSIVNEALVRYQAAIDANPDDYPEDVLGAAYTGTLLMTPGV